MLRENVAGLLSNSRGSLTRADSTHDLSQRPLCTPSSVPTCEVTSCGRKRPRSLASSSSVVLRRWDSDAQTLEDSMCMGCTHHVPILHAEIANLKKQLSRAKMRIKELGGGKACGFKDTEGRVGVLKARIRCSLQRGDISKEQVLGGKVSRKLVGNGSDSSSIQLALSDIQKEIAAEHKRCEEDADRKAMEEHDKRQLEVVKSDPDAKPSDILEETTRKLVICCEKTKQASIENKYEHLDIKPIYISVRKIVADSHAQLMRCPRGSVQDLIGSRDQEGEANCGPAPCDGRQLLIDKYMAEDPPHDDLVTDTFDSPFENDVRIMVRLSASMHILGLPGSETAAITKDAKMYWEFGTQLFNGDGSLEFVEAIKEMKHIVETRKAPKTLIYTQKLLDETQARIQKANRPKYRHYQASKPKRKGNAPQRWPPGVLRALPRNE